jgi:D-tagatose-1,6-bisphosphate aldolase subunit GatZ/KbaZ
VKSPAKTGSRNATNRLRAILQANRGGKGVGIYAICSANRFVLEAGMLQAKRDGSLLLIEATSNQVNQFGGYTGQTPKAFANFVREVGQSMDFPLGRIVLGGDHLGPHVWRNVGAKQAMEYARSLVSDYVSAGFTKIHLDTSMPCADDSVEKNQPLPDELVSARAAELCQAAERTFEGMPRSAVAPVYVIGTEVPIPGGEPAGSHAPAVTRIKNLERTLHLARKAFHQHGLDSAWKRVIAVVVQPGVEFGDESVFDYDARAAKGLSRFCTGHWQGVYEAHSTDYQTKRALREMVNSHFAILKVGPWLTFAFREAVFALEAIERELACMRTGMRCSGVQDALEEAMLENPEYWNGYYRGSERALRFSRRFSYSDRLRYYWPQPKVGSAVQNLIHNLSGDPLPVSLLSQYLPGQAAKIRAGELANHPIELIRDKISEVIDQYASACGMRRDEEAAC